MKEITRELCQAAVATLENVYLDNKEAELMTIEDAISYCYEYFIEMAETDYGFDRSVRFDGKKAILKEIDKLIKQSHDIKLKH